MFKYTTKSFKHKLRIICKLKLSMLYFYRLSDAIDCISTPADAIDIPFMFPRKSNITLFLPEAHSIHTANTFNINELDALRPDFSDFINDIRLQN